MENFSRKQIEALEVLKRVYPKGISTADPEHRHVLDSIIGRGGGLVELVTFDTPTGDAYVLTDDGAEAFRRDDDERAKATFN